MRKERKQILLKEECFLTDLFSKTHEGKEEIQIEKKEENISERQQQEEKIYQPWYKINHWKQKNDNKSTYVMSTDKNNYISRTARNFLKSFSTYTPVSKIFFEVIYILQHFCIHKMLFCNATRNLLTNFHYSKSVPSMLQFPNIA